MRLDFYKGLLIIISFFQSHCKDAKVTAVQVSYNIPVPLADGKIIIDSSSYKVFYYNHLIMYKYPYQFDSISKGNQVSSGLRNGFFIFHKDSLFGYNYDDIEKSQRKTRLKVKEKVGNISLEGEKLDSLILFKPDSILSIGKKLIKECYKIKNSLDRANDYTVWLTFDSMLNDVEESFSRKLDSARKMKLVTIEIMFDKNYSVLHKMNFPKREITYEMHRIPFSTSDKDFYYLKKYQSEVLKTKR